MGGIATPNPMMAPPALVIDLNGPRLICPSGYEIKLDVFEISKAGGRVEIHYLRIEMPSITAETVRRLHRQMNRAMFPKQVVQ